MAVETAGGVPEGINEVEAALGFLLSESHVQRGQRVEGGGGGEEIGHGRARHGDEAALRMQPCAQPLADFYVDGEVQIIEKHHRACGGVSGADGEVGMIVPRVIGRLQFFEALQNTQRLGRQLPHILIRAEGEEGAVRRAVLAFQVIVPTATRFAKGLKALKQFNPQAFRHSIFSQRTPTTREATKVHEVQPIAISKRA